MNISTITQTSSIETETHSTRGYLLAAAAAALWGFSGVVTSYLLRHRQMRPDDLLVFRTGFASLILFAWLRLTAKHLMKIRLADVPYFGLLGLIGLVANQGFYYLALTKVSVGYALMLQYLAPVFLLAYGVWSKTERLTAGKIAAAAMAMTGAVLVLVGQPGGLGQISWLGSLCAIGSGIGFAFYTVYGKHGLRQYDSRTMMAYAFLSAVLIWLMIRPPWKISWSSYTPSMWAFFFYLGAVATVLPFLCYLASLKHLEASRTSLTSILEPVVAAGAAWLWLGQSLWPLQIVGGLAVLAGVLLLQIESFWIQNRKRIN
ncbi:MAG: DMT family transporter [Blastocatellia bacterium]